MDYATFQTSTIALHAKGATHSKLNKERLTLGAKILLM